MEIIWSEEKNAILKSERGLTFEDVVAAIENGRVLADVSDPAPSRNHQRILVVDIGGYACGVPYVNQDGVMFLKTIYRDRKLHRAFMRTKP
jgi:uncharacterized DUF497 family protein